MESPNIPAFYQHAPFPVRLHTAIRWRLFPFGQLVRFVPETGLLVDLGCGHGLWAVTMASLQPAARVLGIDPDASKIWAAQAAATRNGFVNLHFEQALAEEASFSDCALVSLVDVLYLIPFPAQERILAHAVRQMQPGGRLLVKEMGVRPRWKSAWNLFQETLSVRLLGITFGEQFYFRPEGDWVALLNGLGLRVEVIRLDRGVPYPHVLIVGEKVTNI